MNANRTTTEIAGGAAFGRRIARGIATAAGDLLDVIRPAGGFA